MTPGPLGKFVLGFGAWTLRVGLRLRWAHPPLSFCVKALFKLSVVVMTAREAQLTGTSQRQVVRQFGRRQQSFPGFAGHSVKGVRAWHAGGVQ